MLDQLEATETLPVEMPEPVPFPADLDAYEERLETFSPDIEQFPVTFIPLTSDEAAKAAKRRAYWVGFAESIARPYDDEIAYHKAIAKKNLDEASRLELERDAAVKPYLRKAKWYEAPLEAFMRAMNKANDKIKSWPTPFGKLSVTKQQPEWNYGPDKATEEAIAWRLRDLDQNLVRLTPAIDKKALKVAAKVVEGQVYIQIGEGEESELIELEGVKVVQRQAKFEIE